VAEAKLKADAETARRLKEESDTERKAVAELRGDAAQRRKPKPDVPPGGRSSRRTRIERGRGATALAREAGRPWPTRPQGAQGSLFVAGSRLRPRSPRRSGASCYEARPKKHTQGSRVGTQARTQAQVRNRSRPERPTRIVYAYARSRTRRRRSRCANKSCACPHAYRAPDPKPHHVHRHAVAAPTRHHAMCGLAPRITRISNEPGDGHRNGRHPSLIFHRAACLYLRLSGTERPLP